MSRPIRVITFDVGGTILRAHPSVGHVYAQAVGTLGYRVEPEQINSLFRAAWRRSQERRRHAGFRCSDAILRDEWLRVVTESFDGLVPASAVRDIFDGLYDRFSNRDAWRLVSGARETFAALRGDGIRLGILSNWDSRLEATLEAVGVRGFFEFAVVSHAVGYEKPHPAMFREVVRRAGVEPGEILHVGDSLDWDIRPARALGIQTLWLHAGTPWVHAGEALSGQESPQVGPGVARFDELLEALRAHFDLIGEE